MRCCFRVNPSALSYLDREPAQVHPIQQRVALAGRRRRHAGGAVAEIVVQVHLRAADTDRRANGERVGG